MGQVELYSFLVIQAAKGDWVFYTTRQLQKLLGGKGWEAGALAGVRGDLVRLAASGYLDCKMANNLLEFPGSFRIKRKYVIAYMKREGIKCPNRLLKA